MGRKRLSTENGRQIHDTAVEFDVFPAQRDQDNDGPPRRAPIVGKRNGKAAQLARELGLRPIFAGAIKPDDIALIDDPEQYAAHRSIIDFAVEGGALAVFVELPVGSYEIGSSTLRVEPCGMGGRHFVSRDTGHPLVEGFQPEDFKFWYDPAVDRPSLLLDTVVDAPGWTPILMSGNGGWEVDWRAVSAAVEKQHGAGAYRVCQVKLAGRLVNPVARIFAARLLRNRRPTS
ncbi:MAG: hypothetical protein ACUVR3_13180 [Candidatus Roseilinea sp.]|uniref:hypothetical protein n=1 Tax=Candidatus Roseilinea sp. TaxID=2838777 RepID=UPI00404A0BD9